MSNSVIEICDVVTRFGDNCIHDGISLQVRRGEIYGLLGGSGSGKSTLLKEIVMLLRPQSGEIRVLGQDVLDIDHQQAMWLREQWGVLFQSGALFSSMTVADNVAVGLKQATRLSPALIAEIVQMKLNMVGLPAHAGELYPAQLSGGMIKRVALARALAMDPALLFLDEPTSGLDPVGAQDFDKLILKLRDMLGITVVMVTHDLDSIWSVVDRFAVLGDRKLVAEGTLDQVMQQSHPVVKAFFGGVRGELRSSHGK